MIAPKRARPECDRAASFVRVHGKEEFMEIGEGWADCERGNVLLTRGEGMVAWLTLEGGLRLEIDWQPENYPALNVSVCRLDDAALAHHINLNCGGWYVRKCNIDGVFPNKDGEVPEPEEEPADAQP